MEPNILIIFVGGLFLGIGTAIFLLATEVIHGWLDIFEVGWGIAGICPGPSIAGLTFSGTGGWIYFIFMCAGLKIGAPRKTRTKNSLKTSPKSGEVDHRCAQPVFGD